jgi:glycosyltransferase involved in cell wall biosynthesis
MPSVDIVVPVYNGESYLLDTLETINQQTYPYIHVYVVDDHSTDSTPQILADHGSRFPRTIIRHPENRGLSAARNSGIASGSGQYIAILDADDLWRPMKLERQLAVFQSADTSLGIVSSDFQIIDEHGTMRDPTVYNYCRDITPSTRDLLVLGNVVSGGSAALIRRECFERCGGFDESLSACEDWEMWHRIAAHYSIRILREPLVLVRRHSQSMQGDTPRMLRNRIEVFRRFYSDPRCQRMAEYSLRKECVAAFRYLPPTMGNSYDASMEQLQVLGLDNVAVPSSIWRSAYRSHRLTSVLYSVWRSIDERMHLRQQLSRHSTISWLYRGLRWRVQAVNKKFFR